MGYKTEYAKRDLSKAAVKMAGEGLSAYLGDLGMEEMVKKRGAQAGGIISSGAEKIATKLGAAAPVAARIGRFAPAGTVALAAIAPTVLEQLGKSGPSSNAEEIAVRQAGAMGAIDQKLQADLVRQEGYMRMNEQKFQQQLMLQQARADAMTPRNQPMSGSRLFDPIAVGQGIFGGTPQY